MDNGKKQRIKALIIDEGLDKELRQAHLKDFKEGTSAYLDEFKETHGQDITEIAERLNFSRYKKKKKIENHVSKIHELGKCMFLTLTFRDDVLANTTPQQRRRYVARFLKRQTPTYVANIDLGNDGETREYIDRHGNKRESTAREHYHALIQGEFIDVKRWKYGHALVEKVRDEKKKNGDLQAVSDYVAKLSNHAMKLLDGKSPRIIYSRNMGGFLERYCHQFF